MQITLTIQSEIQNYLEQHKLNMSQFAVKAGLNAGTVSGIVMSNRAISVHQLDCVTKAMEKPEDYFYSRYVQEYMLEASLDWRRVKAFLQRCTELNRLDCIAQVVSVLMDNVAYYVPLVFELAEEFFDQKFYKAAEILYENVASGERNQHSERLALSQYRLFTIRIGDDQKKNLRNATLFEAFVERLDEILQLDALKDLANVYRSLREWDEVEEAAKKMKSKAKIQYSMKHQAMDKKQVGSFNKLSRPLFVYITYADLLCASVYEARGDYQQALQFTYAYSNLEWIKETDEDTVHWKNLFYHWAEANIIVNKLLSGDIDALYDYVKYIDTSSGTTDQDMITQLLNIMVTANRYQIDVDDILKRFETITDSFVKQLTSDIYIKQVIPEQFVRLSYELAYYHLNRGAYTYGFKYLMYALEKYHTMNDEAYFIKCMVLFERFRSNAMLETKEKYLKFIERVWMDDVKKDDDINHRS
ncbi:hypothetical protein [Paenibacillus massiliensis]|uniref:hypothetical protein n=1 Tax=Paenibacillus massiliensis TaxID=225917 RepID=UPI000471922C|nr:hypothetical protein [Paenibacillus massiliensis]